MALGEVLARGVRAAQSPLSGAASNSAPLADAEAGARTDAPRHPFVPAVHGHSETDPKELLEQAKYHHSEAQRLHNERLKSSPPSEEHHKTGIGIYLASLGLSALDPTHQAGGSFLNSYEQSKGASEARANKNKAQGWLHEQQVKADQAKAHEATGAAYLKEYGTQAGSREKAREADQKVREDEKKQADLEKFRADTQASKDVLEAHRVLWHASALSQSEDPATVKQGALALSAWVKQNRGKPGFEGWDFDAMEKDAAHLFMHPESAKSQVADLRKRAVEAETKYKTLKMGIDKDKAAQTKVKTQAEIQTINEKLREAKVKFPKDMEKLDEEIAHVHAMTQHLGKDGVSGTDYKKSKEHERMLKSTVSEFARELQKQETEAWRNNPNNLMAQSPDHAKFQAAQTAAAAIKDKLKMYQGKLMGIRHSMGMPQPEISGTLPPATPQKNGDGYTLPSIPGAEITPVQRQEANNILKDAYARVPGRSKPKAAAKGGWKQINGVWRKG